VGGVKAFKIPKSDKTTEMFRADLADAGIPYVDDAGRYVDFHALRHTTGSLLAVAGVHPKVAQAIMRHSTVKLTLGRYSHVYRGQESEAVGKLPNLSSRGSEQEEGAATGTDQRAAHLQRAERPECQRPRSPVTIGKR